MVDLVDQHRGGADLILDATLGRQCAALVDEMNRTGTFHHSASGYGGEIIARGYATASSVVAAWLASPAHHDIMLDPSYTRVGYASVNGIWCMQFA